MSELQNKYRQLSSISNEWFPRIKKVFISSYSGRYDVIFTTNDEKVYGFGDNIFAILGMETPVKVTDPTVIEELCGTDIKKVVFGDRFMAVLTESHEVYTGGLCEYGRCGNGISDRTYCKPKNILIEGQLIVDISCGRLYTLLLTHKQQVYTFGYLTGNIRNSLLIPTLISFESEEITSISSGYKHALALTQTGKVYELCCVKAVPRFKIGPRLIKMPNNELVKQISCGSFHSLLLTTEANIYSFGSNDHGQLGHSGNLTHENNPTLIPSLSIFTEILAFDCQSFAINESNSIEFWGQNVVGDDALTPHKSTLNSLQEAIIHYTKYPFTIEPIILMKDSYQKPKENSKDFLSMQGMPRNVINCLINSAFNIKPEKCDDRKESCPSIVGEGVSSPQTENIKVMSSNRVMRTMAESFNKPKFNDFIFKIKRQECEDLEKDCPSDDPNNGYDIIYCHKWFVEQNCDYLKKVFTEIKSIKESNEMEIKGYSYETYFHFIQYLYTDSIETKDIKLLNELLLLSDMYSDEELKFRCVSVIKPLLNVENVSNFYCSAITNKSPELEEYCFEFMTKNIKSIIKSKDYSQMDPKIAKSFFSKYVEKQK